MDPLLFRRQIQPLEDHDYTPEEINKILKICYPLRGIWEWSMVECASKSILRIFKLVNQQQDKYLVVELDWITDTFVDEGLKEMEYDERWGICWDKDQRFKTTYLFKSLENLLEESESSKTPEWDDYGTSSSETSEEVTVSLTESSVKEIEFSTIERDQKWKDCNPAFNPRLIEDLKKGMIDPPSGFNIDTVEKIVNGIKELEDDQFLAADGSGDIQGTGMAEFGLYGKERCMKSVKMIRFFEQHASEYSLDIDVTQWVEKAEKRTSPWKWIRVGPGYYRDFDWMFLGDMDCITKTINVLKEMGYSPLSDDRISGHEFDFDPSLIFKLSPKNGKCLDVDTGEITVSDKADSYGFVTSKTSKKTIQKIRGYIFDYFVKQYPERWIPGKKNRWSISFFSKLKKGVIIDFSTLEPIKYTAATNSTHQFSTLGFALSKEEKNFSVKDIERAIKEYKNRKK